MNIKVNNKNTLILDDFKFKCCVGKHGVTKHKIEGDKKTPKGTYKLAEAYGAVGIRAKTPDELDEKIKEMINTDKPVIFDCVVDKVENCYPMIPSGKPHNQMLLGPEDEKEEVSDEGKTLV